MNKGERISQFVGELIGPCGERAKIDIVDHPYYRAYFKCWNEQQYYDVLEQIWLNSDTSDDDFFKGLIKAAGAFVHLKKNFEHPTHAKHGKRLRPATRLFALAEKNLAPYPPQHHGLDVNTLVDLLRTQREKIIASNYQTNPWSPNEAPKLALIS